jgi:hypothetical protein
MQDESFTDFFIEDCRCVAYEFDERPMVDAPRQVSTD